MYLIRVAVEGFSYQAFQNLEKDRRYHLTRLILSLANNVEHKITNSRHVEYNFNLTPDTSLFSFFKGGLNASSYSIKFDWSREFKVPFNLPLKEDQFYIDLNIEVELPLPTLLIPGVTEKEKQKIRLRIL